MVVKVRADVVDTTAGAGRVAQLRRMLASEKERPFPAAPSDRLPGR